MTDHRRDIQDVRQTSPSLGFRFYDRPVRTTLGFLVLGGCALSVFDASASSGVKLAGWIVIIGIATVIAAIVLSVATKLAVRRKGALVKVVPPVLVETATPSLTETTDGWYYGYNNQQVGPLTLQRLKDDIAIHPRGRDVLVWRSGFASWKPAKDVVELNQKTQPTSNGGPSGKIGVANWGLWGIGAVLLFAVVLIISGSHKPIRPTETEIKPADYGRCKTDFKICKGKFIKFEGIVKSKGDHYLRIATEVHGYDVFGLGSVDSEIIGSKVIFSGYLTEDHMFNDDVNRGAIEDILMSAAEVKADEDAHPTCEKNWKVCTDNTDLIEHNTAWMFHGVTACKLAADEKAKYGEPKWSWVQFGKYRAGTDYPKTGIVTVADEDVRFQNGFGAYGRSRVVCAYDMNNGQVVNVSVSLN